MRDSYLNFIKYVIKYMEHGYKANGVKDTFANNNKKWQNIFYYKNIHSFPHFYMSEHMERVCSGS